MLKLKSFLGFAFLTTLASISRLHAGDDKLTIDERIDLLRGLDAEFATVQITLPRSKKPLEYRPGGHYDKTVWEQTASKLGPAARTGESVQITQVKVEKSRILLEINHGFKGSGGGWRDRIQVSGGIGGAERPIHTQQNTNAPSGTMIALLYEGDLPKTAAQVKKDLKPILDFDPHSATETFSKTLAPEVQQAVKDQRPVEGMNRETVILAMGRPRSKHRETKDGVEYEDWIYGIPPGKVTFVTFDGDKVVKIQESFAEMGGQVSPNLPVR